MGGLAMVMRPLNLIGSIILARLLDPADFGSVALAMVLLESTNIFAGLSMSQAYIQSDLDAHSSAFHAFVITAVSSSFLFLITFFNVAWLASFLGDPAIEPILRALTLLIPLGALSLVPFGILSKELKFGAIAKASVISTTISLISTILLAFLGAGVWSLVIGNLLRVLFEMIFTWLFTPGWNWVKPVPWDWTVVKSLMRFGLPATGAGFVAFFYSKWDDWLVGRHLGTTSLGYYSKAYDFTHRMINQISTNVVGSVFFPTYVKLRDQKEKMLEAYSKSVQLLSTIMFPIGMGLLSTSALLIPVLLGEKWSPMVPTFQVFSILVLTRPISVNTSSIFSATGIPQHNLYAGMILTAVLVPMALLLLPYGIVGVATAVLMGDTVGLAYNLNRINKILPGALKATFIATLPPLAAAIIMALIVIGAQNLLLSKMDANIWSLTIIISLGVFVYFAGTLLFQKEFSKDVIQTIVRVINPKDLLAKIRITG